MTPHDTPAGPPLREALAAWEAATNGTEALDALAMVAEDDRCVFARLVLGSPEDAAKLLQEVAPDDAVPVG